MDDSAKPAPGGCLSDDPGTVTAILQSNAARPEAIASAVSVLYKELSRIASRLLQSERDGHSIMTTDLLHETYMRLLGLDSIEFRDRGHFFATAAGTMRRILVDHARARGAKKRIPAESLVAPELSNEPAAMPPSADILSLDRVLRHLEAVSPQQSRMVEMRYFGGLTEDQVASVFGLSRRTVTREMRLARLWLRHQIQGGSTG